MCQMVHAGRMGIERRLAEMGVALPQPVLVPPGVVIPFGWVRVHGNRALRIRARSPRPRRATRRSLWQGSQPGLTRAGTALGAPGDAGHPVQPAGDPWATLDRVTAWLSINGFINAEPGYPQTTAVMNPRSHLIVDWTEPMPGRTPAPPSASRRCH